MTGPFGREFSLKKRDSFLSLIKTGKVQKSYPMILRYQITGAQEQPLKLGIAVAKRRFPLAVTRNRLKRQIRAAAKECYYDQLSEKLDKSFTLEVLVIYTGKAETEMADLQKAFLKAINSPDFIQNLNKI